MEERELAFELLKRFKNEKIEISQVKSIFNEEELQVYDKLLLGGSIIKMFDKETLKDIINLTVKGQHLLFTYENEDKIKEFETALEYQGYNTEYLPDFIKARNINDKLDKVFSLEDYDAFTKYARRIVKNTGTQKLVLKK